MHSTIILLFIIQILLLLTSIIQAGGYGLIRPLSNYGHSSYGQNYGYGPSNYDYDDYYDNSIRPTSYRPSNGGYRPGYTGLDYGGNRGDYYRGRYDNYYGGSRPQNGYYGRPTYNRGDYSYRPWSGYNYYDERENYGGYSEGSQYDRYRTGGYGGNRYNGNGYRTGNNGYY